MTAQSCPTNASICIVGNFVLPVATLAIVAACVLGLVLVWFVVAGVRNPLLHRLGLRTIARQRLRAALIVAGLTLSSTVAGSALGAGDTITNTLQSLVAGSLGTVDEVIVFNPPRARFFQRARALIDPGFGGLAAARLQFFDQAEVERVQQAARSTDAIAAVAPSIVEQVTVVGERQVRSAVALLALPVPYDAAFGVLFDADGSPVAQTALASDQVILNQAAADVFGSSAGQMIQVLRADEMYTLRVAAVVANGGLGGVSPLLIVPLDAYQTLTNHHKQINQIIVANVGGSSSVARSDDAARAMRLVLTDLDVARQLHDLIGRADIQHALLELEADTAGRTREQVSALRVEASRSPMSDEFVRLIAAPQIRGRLFALASRAGSNGREASGLLRRLNDLNVLDIKQEALNRAQTFGSAITTIFLVLGIVSLFAAILLVFLIFHLLAADRGVELATLRALGMRRNQIMTLFLVEGLAYNLLGAAVGTVASVGAVVALTGSIDDALATYGVRLQQDVQLVSLLLAFAGSAVVTFVAMLFAAYRVSHGAIVGGTRGESEAERPVVLRVALGVVLLLVAGLAWWRWHVPAASYLGRHPLVVPGVLSLVVWGVTSCTMAALRVFRRQRGRGAASAVTTLACLITGVIWLPTLQQTPAGATLETRVVAVAVGAVVLLIVAVALVAQVLGPALALLDRALAWLPRARAAARPAISYLQVRRGRAGMTIAMFAMVVSIMVAALTLIGALLTAYASDEPPVGGYALRADVADGTTFDLDTALASASAVTPDAFSAYGGIATLDAQVIDLSLTTARWGNATIVVADDGFLAGLRAGVRGAVDDVERSGDTWRTLAAQPGAAVVVGAALDTSNAENPSVGRTLWVRVGAGGTPMKLTVVGTGDARSSLESGIYIGRGTAERLNLPIPAPTTYYFAVSAGTRSTDAAQGLRISFGAGGLSVTELDATADIARSVRVVLTAIVQGFMGIGLVAGVAALGLLGVQSVLERRQQLGTLRALGFRRRDVRATLAWEGTTVGTLGVVLGTTLGLLLANSVIAIVGVSNPEVRFVVPWLTIVQAMALALLGATLAIAIAAWRAGRIAPAEALRLD